MRGAAGLADETVGLTWQWWRSLSVLASLADTNDVKFSAVEDTTLDCLDIEFSRPEDESSSIADAAATALLIASKGGIGLSPHDDDDKSVARGFDSRRPSLVTAGREASELLH